MPSGGARNRSGPPKDPKSDRSDQLGVRFAKLPRGGFTGRVPAWPLTTPATKDERKVWAAAWRTPQAAAWASEPWRHRTVAMWVRWSVRSEDPAAPAAALTASIRLADQIGLTPAGMSENGWEIEEAPASRAALEAQAAAEKPGPPPVPAALPRDRLKVVGGHGGR